MQCGTSFILAGARRGLPFGNGHSDIESLASGIIRLLVAEFYGQRILIRERFSFFYSEASLFETGSGGIVSLASIPCGLADRSWCGGRSPRCVWHSRLSFDRRRSRGCRQRAASRADSFEARIMKRTVDAAIESGHKQIDMAGAWQESRYSCSRCGQHIGHPKPWLPLQIVSLYISAVDAPVAADRKQVRVAEPRVQGCHSSPRCRPQIGHA